MVWIFFQPIAVLYKRERTVRGAGTGERGSQQSTDHRNKIYGGKYSVTILDFDIGHAGKPSFIMYRYAPLLKQHYKK